MIAEFKDEFAFLSNFFAIWIEHEGLMFPSVEHAFQASKTLDISQRICIAQTETPGKAKRAGRKVTLRPDWEEIKIDVMRELLKKKFSCEFLAKKLQETEGELIEGNNWGDIFWGVCNGQGENHLGKLLMEIRDNNGKENK